MSLLSNPVLTTTSNTYPLLHMHLLCFPMHSVLFYDGTVMLVDHTEIDIFQLQVQTVHL